MEQWDIDIIPELKEKRIFYLVDGNKYVGIEECFYIWTDYPETVFEYQNRLAGSPDSIKNFLLSFEDLDVTEDSVDTYIKSAISFENYTDTKSAKYNEEKDKRYNRQKNTLMASTMEKKDNLYTIMLKLNPTMTNPSTPVKKPKIYRELPGAKKGLESRLSLLGEDEYLNVSKINDKGIGARKIKNLKKDMFSDSETKLASDNYDGILLALKLIPGGTEHYDKTLRRARNFFNGSKNTPSKLTPLKIAKTIPKTINKTIHNETPTKKIVNTVFKSKIDSNTKEPDSVKPLFRNFKEKSKYMQN